MRKVFKTVYTVTVLSQEEISPHTKIEDVIREMDDGAWIGEVAMASTDEIAPEQVESELLKIGNDGSFFGEEDND